MKVDSTTPILLADHERYSVRRAAHDLISDIEQVTGQRLRLAPQRSPEAACAIVVESDGMWARTFGIDKEIAAAERFLIRRVKIDGRDTVLISGNGERGAIYGIYHFSEMQLGTDPFQFWTEYVPPRRQTLELTDVDYTSPPPAFAFRGFHLERISDIHGWKAVRNTHSMSEIPWMDPYWTRVFETILRAKGNMVKPENNWPGSPEVSLAQDMGLCITQEHAAPLGLWTFEAMRRDPGFVPSYVRNRDGFIEAWEHAMQRYPRPENVIWTVGLRGAGDRPFWIDDPQADTDEKRGAIITDAIRTQVGLVEKRFGHLNPFFIHNMWMEGVRMMKQGHVRLPEQVHPVWADNGYGTFRGMIAVGVDPSQVTEALPERPTGGRDGVYVHVSMYDMCAPDLAQFVPPERIQKTLGRAMEKEATAYLLVNVGRVREQVVGAQSVMEFGWGNNAWTDPKQDGAEEFWKRWCVRHFGSHADAARASYRDLYDLPIRWGKWGRWDDYCLGEMGYCRLARQLAYEVLNAAQKSYREAVPWKFFNNQAMTFPQQIEFLRAETRAAGPKLHAARERAAGLLDQMDGQPKLFFDADVVAQLEIIAFSNDYLQEIIEACALYDAGTLPEAAVRTCNAQRSLQQVRAAMQRMEHGKWEGWNQANYWAGLEIADDTCTALLTVIELMTKPRRG